MDWMETNTDSFSLGHENYVIHRAVLGLSGTLFFERDMKELRLKSLMLTIG